MTDEISEENALACLLTGDVVFINNLLVNNEWTTVVYVNCSDVFFWASADALPISNEEIVGLYREWKKSPAWGPVKWACAKRNLKPQEAIIRYMKKDGVWDDQMESLPNQ